MRQFSSVVMALMVALLLWNNCARCTTAPTAPSAHDCCKKPSKQNCDLNAADLTKSTTAAAQHSEEPLADMGVVVTVAQAAAPVVYVASAEPVVSPPDACLLNSVFRL
jgi:hypothetical protein